jgi:type I restriction-modification system DNA methylase subunit
MFTLGCANMILRHDGKSNMFNGSCFDNSIIEKVKELKPTVCFINPPYAQKNENESELDFIDNALNMLSNGGRLAAIVPISTAIEMSKSKIAKREKILKNHRLDAVFSMPDELFYPVGVNSCIMLFTANIKHDNLIPTYFGYWKDDGFVKTKTNGRCDKYNKYQIIKEQWLTEFKSKKVIDGKSAFEKVNHNDEWCAEAYMNVDYSTITESDFEQRIREYLAFQIKNNEYTVVSQNNLVSSPVVEEEKIGVFE